MIEEHLKDVVSKIQFLLDDIPVLLSIETGIHEYHEIGIWLDFKKFNNDSISKALASIKEIKLTQNNPYSFN